MINKWKHILINWINCYFNETNLNEKTITLDTLLSIISHLRENLNLDDSKSSILEAHTVEEFIVEKFPEFKFENGSVEASNEEEIYTVASLLLLFVCVNSKDVDIKNAMCCKLTTDDQEIILKFSKCLMERSPILYRDVQAAITEACGENISLVVCNEHPTVAETPPALRSLHSEVRRLQAALEAERFDRNYLQEELARTNARFEKLSKDKEEYKLEIVNLKAKISMYCVQEPEMHSERGIDPASAKLMKQLHQLEERLVEVQGQLDEVQYERDSFKAKVEKLKQERDKWLLLSQQETSRADELSEKLECEQREIVTLKELVADLKQHYRLNNDLDSSQLECDDDGTMIPSHHNMSVCSEVCANVIEVQLGEERAKIVDLELQIQLLQDQLNILNERTANEKNTYEKIILEKETDIANLQQSISEEMYEKNNLKKHYDDEIKKLQNDNNVLEKKLKEVTESLQVDIDKKLIEIQTIQLEKRSLLQNFSEETTKFENIIKTLNTEINVEKISKTKLKENYENQIQKLNEEIFVMNNELLELKNITSGLEKVIDNLKSDFDIEKSLKLKLTEDYKNQIRKLNEELLERTNGIVKLEAYHKNELTALTDNITELNQKMKDIVESSKLDITKKLQEIEVLRKDKLSLQQNQSDVITKLESNIKILTLEIDAEKSSKLEMQENYETEIRKLNKQLLNARNELEELQTSYNDKTSMLNTKVNELEQKLNDITENSKRDIDKKILEIKTLQEDKLLLSQSFSNTIIKLENNIKHLKLEIDAEKSFNLNLKEDYENKLTLLMDETMNKSTELENLQVNFRNEVSNLNNTINEFEQKLRDINKTSKLDIERKVQEIQALQEEKISLLQSTSQKTIALESIIKDLQSVTNKERSSKLEMQQDYEKEITMLNKELLNKNNELDKLQLYYNNEVHELNSEINQLEQKLKDFNESANHNNEKKMEEIKTLQSEKESILQNHSHETMELACIIKDLQSKLDMEKSSNLQMKECYENEILKSNEISSHKNNELIKMETYYNDEVGKLRNTIKELEQKLNATTEKSKLDIEMKIHEIKILQDEKLLLLKNISVETSKLENIIKDVKSEMEMEKLSTMKLKDDYENEMRKLNEQISRKNKELFELQTHCNAENGKLILQINEYEQKLKDYSVHNLSSKLDFEKKVEQVHILSNKITELEIIIKDLQLEIEMMKSSKSKIKGDYENQIIKLNEKMLSNYNELLELKANYNDEISKLNNEINELEQRSEETTLNLKLDIEKKIDEIKRLQEGRSLLQENMSSEKIELESIIRNLKTEIGVEKLSKLETKEEYENQIMKINEKVLNRNNELVQLQTNISETSETIEALYCDLRKEKALREELSNQFNLEITHLNEQRMVIENNLQQVCEEAKVLKQQLDEKVVFLDDLMKVGEQQKLEISDLKAMLSICRQDAETQYEEDVDSNSIILIDQLPLIEDRLLEVQVQLNDTQHERDSYKDQVKELKEERDKFLLFSQQATSKADKLAEKLKNKKEMFIKIVNEKETNISKLKHHINAKTEEKNNLQEHHNDQIMKLNNDINELEQKFKDSIKNSKLDVEKKTLEIKTLQEERLSLLRNHSEEKMNLETTIKDLKSEVNLERLSKQKLLEAYENQIMKLNDLISGKNNDIVLLKANHNDEISELNNKINELDQKLTESTENFKKDIELRTHEIQKLQEEKSSLLQCLSDENTKFENVVLSLKSEAEMEKLSKLKMKEDYESKIMNLNDKVLNRNNELVELQNNISQKSETIEALHYELRREKDLKEQLSNQFNLEMSKLNEQKQVIENKLYQTTEKAKELQTQLEEKVTLLDKMAFQELPEVRKENESLANRLIEVNKEKEDLRNALSVLKQEKEAVERNAHLQKIQFSKEIASLNESMETKELKIQELVFKNKEIYKNKEDISALKEENNKKKIENDSLSAEITKLTQLLHEKEANNDKLESLLKRYNEQNDELQGRINVLNSEICDLVEKRNVLEKEKGDQIVKHKQLDTLLKKQEEELHKLKKDNSNLVKVVEENKNVITNLEQLIQHELEQNQHLRVNIDNEKLNLSNKCTILEEYQIKAEKELDDRQKKIKTLQEEVKTLESKINKYEEDLSKKDSVIITVMQEKDAVIKQLKEEKVEREKCQKELEEKLLILNQLTKKLVEVKSETEMLKELRKENEVLVRVFGQKDTIAMINNNKLPSKHSDQIEKEAWNFHHQVDNTSSTEHTHSSLESLKTITDLEKIIHDKNRTITTLQNDISYLKVLMAESENRLLDVTKELEVNRENCQQLSNQLKKIVHQKNEEIADLKKQVSKMSAAENRATQIIKVSAKYQGIILKRITEIKTNTVLKELTNFGNSSNYDNELKRSLTDGKITMEDLENFLETTDRHLRRCAEKQLALQKERDRLVDINRIHESENINLKKFLTELSLIFRNFSNMKDLYTHKLSRIVSLQRTVRREILDLDGHITDATMCKLERGYAAAMQDLAESAMNLERWVERSIGRTIAPEKINQAFSKDVDNASLSSTSFQNTSIEIQLEELEKSFQKLLEETARAQKGEGAKDAQAITVMEVRAEYEDKLNRMKAKMKQLYQEQISVFKEKQREDIALLERELQKAKDKLAESSRAYEEHIRALTTELWSVGEKFLMKKDEAEWLRKRQQSGSLMSLQHVHSSGLAPHREEPSRPSDTYSLRSLPVTANTKNDKDDGRALHMSDEEGEVFDNRCLRELASTPSRRSPPASLRLSELRWRNSLCPPHLKSSYPAETQFAPAAHEDDIKCIGPANSTSGRQQRKEVGITAYKKPGPPTPSKQAGRLSATDSELRESLRVDPDPHPSRKTSTPSRIRSLFRSARNDGGEGTPRSRRLSNIFRKK